MPRLLAAAPIWPRGVRRRKCTRYAGRTPFGNEGDTPLIDRASRGRANLPTPPRKSVIRSKLEESCRLLWVRKLVLLLGINLPHIRSISTLFIAGRWRHKRLPRAKTVSHIHYCKLHITVAQLWQKQPVPNNKRDRVSVCVSLLSQDRERESLYLSREIVKKEPPQKVGEELGTASRDTWRSTVAAQTPNCCSPPVPAQQYQHFRVDRQSHFNQ